jgi:hypothetical protein
MKASVRCTVLLIAAIVTYLAMLAVNALSALLPLGGLTPAQVSDQFPNLFTPAGLTFSIWGLIYLLLGLNLLYQISAKQTREELLCQINVPFALSSVANIFWIFSWHSLNIPLSLAFMLILLVSLIWIMRLITAEKLKPSEKFFIKLPFALYLGWITVATIANVTVLLVSIGWNGFGLPPEVWTVIVLAVGAVIGILTGIRFDSIAYLLVLIWGYAGIVLRHVSPAGLNGQYPAVIAAASICIILFILTIAWLAFKGRRARV